MKNIFRTVIVWLTLMVALSCNTNISEKKEVTISKSEDQRRLGRTGDRMHLRRSD